MWPLYEADRNRRRSAPAIFWRGEKMTQATLNTLDAMEEIAVLRQQITALALATGAAKADDYFMTDAEKAATLKKWEYHAVYDELTKNNQSRIELLRDVVYESKKMTTREVKNHFSLKHLSNASYFMKKAAFAYPAELELVQVKMNRRNTKMLILKNVKGHGISIY